MAVLSAGDFLRMNAAENQQVVVFRQMLQRLNRSSDTLVFVEEPEHADQRRIGRQLVEHRKCRRAAPARIVSTSPALRNDSG